VHSAHLQAFGEERTRYFIGRDGQLVESARYLNASDRQVLLVTGPSGSGASALIAEAARRASERHPCTVIVERYCGASTLRGLLDGISRQITQAYGRDEAASSG
jgi:energy-coupling factor transporter ATP-binding protein EcfA2